MVRTGGIKAGALVAIGDIGKAVLAVYITTQVIGARLLFLGPVELNWQAAQVMTALAAMAGHNWSCFLRFKGGRGVAVFFGSWLAINPATALFAAEILVLAVLLSRYMSLGSMMAALGAFVLLSILTVFFDYPPVYLVYGLVTAALIVYQHRDNILRIQNGTERRVGEKAERRKA